MISPISNSHPMDVQRPQPPAAPAPEPPAPAPKSGELSTDKVTLKRAGDVDQDGDSQ